MQAIILAGGLGTRLRETVPDRPKTLAPIGDRPFLYFLLDHLRRYGIVDIILSVGFLAEHVMEACGDGSGLGLRIRYAREESPLGTGGALRKALPFIGGDHVLVINGDSWLDLNYQTLETYHRRWDAGVTVALKYRTDLGRYGVTDLIRETDLSPSPSKGRGEGLGDLRSRELYRVTAFRERPGESESDGYINGGVYMTSRGLLEEIPEGICSLEKQLLPGWVGRQVVYGLPFGGRFIDIGVPGDYRIACAELDQWVNTPKTRALFLDRDGVINEDLGYVYRKEQIRLLPAGIRLIREANREGRKVIVLTNQAGIARGYYSEGDIHQLHDWLTGELAGRGVVVDGWYYCPHHPEGTMEKYRRTCYCRKPKPGMVLQAAEEMGINVEESRMVGDQASDRIWLPYLISEIYEKARK